jgi:hypothetical protein
VQSTSCYLPRPPPPQHTVLEGRRGGRIRAQASAGGRHKRVGAGGLRGRVGEGGLRGRAYHGRNLPRYLIACTRHAVHVPHCMHKARRACASPAQLSRPVRVCVRIVIVGSCVRWRGHFAPRRGIVVLTHRVTLCQDTGAAWGAGGASSYVTTSCARSRSRVVELEAVDRGRCGCACAWPQAKCHERSRVFDLHDFAPHLFVSSRKSRPRARRAGRCLTRRTRLSTRNTGRRLGVVGDRSQDPGISIKHS